MNNPSDLPTTLAGALTANQQLGAGGEVYGAWWEGAATAMAAATATILGVLQTNCSYGPMLLEIKNVDTPAFNACKIQILATPDGDWIDYVTSAQLNAGTAIAGVLLAVVGNPTTLAGGANALAAIQTNGAWGIQVIATSASACTGQLMACARRFG